MFENFIETFIFILPGFKEDNGFHGYTVNYAFCGLSKKPL